YVAGTKTQIGSVNALAVDDTYVYAGDSLDYSIHVYLKSDMSYVTSSKNVGYGIYCIKIDGTNVIIGTGGTGLTVFKSTSIVEATPEA
ncbi:MAG: hypothetical protein WC554_10825, partial [Clostridia bacterium]